jgi:cytochrome c peroxidase
VKLLLLASVAAACGGVSPVGTSASLPLTLDAGVVDPNEVVLGQMIFFDPSLSQPPGESCSTCHDPTYAYADPISATSPTSQGATVGLFGPRNTPSIVYAAYIPPLSATGDDEGYGGGLFWDGRARTLEAQAGGPMLNPIEMGNPDQATVVGKLQAAPYASMFQSIYGQDIFLDAGAAFSSMTHAIAQFERFGIPGRFTSNYDLYLAGQYTLSDSEARGLAVFEDTAHANCVNCHPDQPSDSGAPPMFTDFGYDNIGIPQNPNNLFYQDPAQFNPQGAAYVDDGLGGSIHNPREFGAFRAQTLRNIARTAPYGHNGYFPDLKALMQFYNNRDVPDAGWPAPEIDWDMNTHDMGNLGLTDQQLDDLVAFMGTLTDNQL